MYLGLEAEDGEGEDYEDPDSDKWVGAYRAPIALPRDDTGSNVGSNRNSNASEFTFGNNQIMLFLNYT